MDLKKEILKIVKQSMDRYDFRNYHDFPTDKQIKHAISSYAKECSVDDFAMLYDTSVTGNGKKGFLFSIDAIYTSFDIDYLISKNERTSLPIYYNDYIKAEVNNHRVELTHKDGSVTKVYLSIYSDFFVDILNEIIEVLNNHNTTLPSDSKEKKKEVEQPKFDIQQVMADGSVSGFNIQKTAVVDGETYYYAVGSYQEKYIYLIYHIVAGKYQVITDEQKIRKIYPHFEEKLDYDLVQEKSDGTVIKLKILKELEKDNEKYVYTKQIESDDPYELIYKVTQDGYALVTDEELLTDLTNLYLGVEPENNSKEEHKQPEDNIIILNDENGTEIEYEFLDLIEYQGNDYVILLPVASDDGEVVILKVDDTTYETETYVAVDSQEDLQAIFEIFKNKFKDEFEFKTDHIKPEAYNGDEPYIFISYAHKDNQQVLPIIRQLQKDGCRVWYDEGIEPGKEWDDYIADHLEKSSCFIGFISENYVNSSNCRDEINYARDLELKRLLIYIDDVKLTGGLAMRLNRLQALFYHKYEIKQIFYKRLYEASVIKDSNVKL